MDIGYISTRIYNQVILEQAVIGIISQVDMGIDVLNGNSLVDAAFRCPPGWVIPDKIIVVGDERFVCDDPRLAVGINKINPVSVRTKSEQCIGTKFTSEGTVVRHVVDHFPVFWVVLDHGKSIPVDKKSTVGDLAHESDAIIPLSLILNEFYSLAVGEESIEGG